jgi:dipeptidase E
MARQIVVSGGAGYWCGPEGSKLDDYALSLTGVSRPRICAVCTASGDSESYLRGFYDQFQDRCEVSHLSLFVPPFDDPAQLIARQDLIYVGGGSTANLLAVWRLHGIDRLLGDALDRGTILYGSSAGGICWFESGLTDSLSFDGTLRPLTNGLGVLDGSHAPHFDRPDRRDIYAAMVADGRLQAGVGIDDFAAVHYLDGAVHRVVASRARASASTVVSDGRSGVAITALRAELI